jgi:hypothetical protein
MWVFYFYGALLLKPAFVFSCAHLLIFERKTRKAAFISKSTKMATSSDDKKPLSVAFCHPDLGLGGKLVDLIDLIVYEFTAP